jgi:beta-lactamase regulating signal transducer with metallopeptidase domain
MNVASMQNTWLTTLTQALGWTLVHFVWQGALIALVLFFFVRLTRNRAPQLRYMAGCAALALMCATAVATLVAETQAVKHGSADSSKPIVVKLPEVAESTVPVEVSARELSAAAGSIAHVPTNVVAATGSTASATVPTANAIVPTPGQRDAIDFSVFKSLPKSLSQQAGRMAQGVEPYLPWIVCLWALGVVVFSLRLLAGWNAVRELRVAADATEAQWIDRFNRLKARLGVSYAVRLVFSTSAAVPMVIGWLKPVVLVPAGLVAGLSAAQLEAILAHELIHIRRHDYLVNLIQNVVETVFFYHPAVAWVSIRIRVEREHCCDDAASLACGGTLDYARALAALAESQRAPALGIAASGGSLVERIRRLVGAAIVPSRRGTSTAVPILFLLLAGLGTLGVIASVALSQRRSIAANSDRRTASSVAGGDQLLNVSGLVVDEMGGPIDGVDVAVIRFEGRSHLVGETKTDRRGYFRLPLVASFNSYIFPTLVARSPGYGLTWRPFNPDAPSVAAPIVLVKEQILRGRFVDLQGQPAAGVHARVVSVRRPGRDDRLSNWVALFDDQMLPTAWPRPVTSDRDGRFAVAGIRPGLMVVLNVQGNNRVESQQVALPRGWSEGSTDSDNRDSKQTQHTGAVGRAVRNASSNGETVLPLTPSATSLQPSRVIEGVVQFEDTHQPMAKGQVIARVGDFAGWREIKGHADEQGRFQIATSLPGNRFQVIADPPDAGPYLIGGTDFLTWPTGALKAHVKVGLPRGIVVRGKIVEGTGKKPIADASIRDFGQNGSAKRSNQRGEFEIVVPQGRSALLVDGPTANYVHEVAGAMELASGRGGGERVYSHAIRRLNLTPGSAPPELTIELRRGVTLFGRVLTSAGQPAEQVLILSRLMWPTFDATSGMIPETDIEGRFSLAGCAPGEEYPIYFLDPAKREGATVRLSAISTNNESVTVRLVPCGTAKARFVNSKGEPTPFIRPLLKMVVTPSGLTVDFRRLDAGMFSEDGVLVSNFDGLNYRNAPTTDAEGRATFPALIPGASYRLNGRLGEPAEPSRPFVVGSGETRDLGDVLTKGTIAGVALIQPATSGIETMAANAVEANLPASPEHKSDVVTLRGQVLRPDGQPAAGARVSMRRNYWTNNVKWLPVAVAKADGTGNFELSYRPSQFVDDVGTDAKSSTVAAEAEGFGAGWVQLGDVEGSKPLVLKLVAEVPIRGRVVDLEGKPVAGVHVRMLQVREPKDGQDLGPWLETIKSGAMTNAQGQTLGRVCPGVEDSADAPVITDSDGRFTLRGFGAERDVRLELRGESVAYRQIDVATRDMKPMKRQIWFYAGTDRPPITDQVFGANFTIEAAPTKPVVGTVRDRATGKPLAGIPVESEHLAGMIVHPHNSLVTKTDANGRFRLLGMPKGNDEDMSGRNVIRVAPGEDQPYFTREIDVPDSQGVETVTADVDLAPGQWFTGRVTDQVTGKPVSASINFPFLDNPNAKPPEFRADVFGGGGEEQRFHTHADGTYRVLGLPGRAIVGAWGAPSEYRKGVGASQIAGMDKRGAFRTYRRPFPADVNFLNALKEVNPTDWAASTTCDFALESAPTIHIHLVDGAGQPVSGAAALDGSSEGQVTGSTVKVKELAPHETRNVAIYHQGRQIGKYLVLKADEKLPSAMTVTLEPCAMLVGRLVDDEGIPFQGVEVQASPAPGTYPYFFIPIVVSHADGTFECRGMFPGCDYGLVVHGSEVKIQFPLRKIAVEPGKTVELGNVKLKRRPVE